MYSTIHVLVGFATRLAVEAVCMASDIASRDCKGDVAC